MENSSKQSFFKSHMFKQTLKIVLIVIVTVSLLLNLFTFVMPVVKYYGSSMSPTLKDGQILIVNKMAKIDDGDIVAFYYKIDDIVVVEPDEVSRLSVLSGKDCVTLVTCTPYGVNSHRLLVRGVRVDGNDLSAKEDGIINELLNIDIKYLLTFSLIGLCIIFVIVKKLRNICKNKAIKKEGDGEQTNEDPS